jgi:hypothetical protein
VAYRLVDNLDALLVSNSETGHGSFLITPRLIAQVCGNGYTITRDAMREVHLGGRASWRGAARLPTSAQPSSRRVLDLVGRRWVP